MGDFFIAAHKDQIPADRFHIIQVNQQIAFSGICEICVIVSCGVVIFRGKVGEILRIVLQNSALGKGIHTAHVALLGGGGITG